MAHKTPNIAKLFVAYALIFSTVNCYAAFLTGNELLENIVRSRNSTSDYFFNGVGSGYVMGVVDSTDGKRFCIPRGVVVKQIEDTVRTYLINNPQFRHLPADHLVGNALSNAFPCTK